MCDGPGVTPPPKGILEKFGVQLVSHLNTRVNQHWLVDAEGKRRVLRRFGSVSMADAAYEAELLSRLAGMGWPVASVIEGPTVFDGHIWCLFPYLEGSPKATDGIEQRARGRLMAAFHEDSAHLADMGQREGWRRCEVILSDAGLDRILSENGVHQPEEVRVLRWHLDRARERISGLNPHRDPSIMVHGDFAPWNLLYSKGHLSGILDFELSHMDHRVADFALSWRGKYDEVIHGYHGVSPIRPEEMELLTPLWWAGLIDGHCRLLDKGIRDDGWYIRKLLQRSPLMGPDSVEYRG